VLEETVGELRSRRHVDLSRDGDHDAASVVRTHVE
jgi:hypothetical protein